tara:strand:- start:3940 stop:4461 length:522 start_codon:yes stop_codon:yes gene_type:complete
MKKKSKNSKKCKCMTTEVKIALIVGLVLVSASLFMLPYGGMMKGPKEEPRKQGFWSGLFSDDGQKASEFDWKMAFNEKVADGRMGITVRSGTVDIVNDDYAIEVTSVTRYERAVASAIKFAHALSKEPAVALYINPVDAQDGKKLYREARKYCRERNVKLWLVNDYVEFEELK